MVKKHKVPAHVATLADKYFCEQCVRLGLEVPPDKGPDAPRHVFRPLSEARKIEKKPLKLGDAMREVDIQRGTAREVDIERKLALEDLYLRSKL